MMTSAEGQHYDLGDLTARSMANSPFDALLERKQHSASPSPPLLIEQSRKTTRGCRFQDLNEAHRSIIGPSISNNYSNSLSRSCSSSSELQGQQSSNAGSIAYSDEIASPDMSDLYRSLTSNDDDDEVGFDFFRGPGAVPTSAPAGLNSAEMCSSQPETPNSMVKRVCKLYQPQMDLSPASDDKVEKVFHEKKDKPSFETPQAPPDRDGANTRLSFHPDDTEQPRSGSGEGNVLASEIGIAVDHSNKTDEYQPQDLASTAWKNVLFPVPLRVQSIRGENRHASCRSGTALSADGLTEDSDDDPFRYDKNPYKMFLQPSKEREVSAALKHIGSLNSHSRATLCSQAEDTTPIACQTSLLQPPISKEYQEKHDRPDSALGDHYSRALTPEDSDEFYDTSIIRPNLEAERGMYEVRVVLKDGDAPRLPEKHDLNDLIWNRKDKYVPERKKAVNVDLYYDVGQENTVRERDEWETVAASVAGFGSTAPSFPFDEYASTDRIVQPSSGQEEESEKSLQNHILNGSNIPVMVPKQRVHRVNGLAQDSSHRLPQTPCSGSEAAAALTRAVPKPFRRASTRRIHAFSPLPLQAVQSKTEESASRFDFRVSQTSDYEELCAPEYELKDGTANTATLGADLSNATASSHGGTAVTHEDTGLRGSASSQSSSGTIHSFSFSLIPLPEAARLQAIKRRTDLLECGTVAADGGAPTLRPSHTRMPVRRFPSLLTPTPAYRQKQQHMGHRHIIHHGPVHNSNAGSTDPDTSWETVTPSGRTRGAARALKSAATRVRLDNLIHRSEQPQQPQQPQRCPTPARRSSSAPRLYPWDYQHRNSSRQSSLRQGGNWKWHGQLPQKKHLETDPEPREIAARSTADADYLERAGVPLDPEAFLSEDARRRRRAWFAYMMVISVMLPFLSVMVYLGRFDCGLSWYTHGEVARLNLGQRRAILATMVLQFVLWPSVLICVIWQQQ